MAGEGHSNPTPLLHTPDGWSVAAIEDLCENVTSGGTPLRSDSSYYQGGIHSWFRTQELKDSVLFESEEKITDKALARTSAKLFPKNTVLMAMYGDGKTITSLGILAKEAATNQACCAMIPDRAHCEPRFLFYALKHHREDFIRIASGGAQRNLSGKLIRRFAINTPPLDEQRAIGRILGRLDDKIELNRRMNETLEAMARALFKSWFVDFDPVRAKAEGRDPSLAKPLADLFPARLVGSELDEIPEGWAVGGLGMLGELAIGGDWGDDDASKGAVEAVCLRGVDLEHLRRDGQASAPRRWFKPSSLERRAMDDRDVLVAGSGAGPTGRSLWMCSGLLQALGPCVYSNFCKRIRCTCAASAVYLDAWLHTMRESGEIWEYVNGTSVPNLDAKSLLAGKEVPIPPMPVLDRYHDFARPIWQEKYAGENNTLAALRDTLLPKLFSGELRVKDAEKLVRRAV